MKNLSFKIDGKVVGNTCKYEIANCITNHGSDRIKRTFDGNYCATVGTTIINYYNFQTVTSLEMLNIKNIKKCNFHCQQKSLNISHATYVSLSLTL